MDLLKTYDAFRVLEISQKDNFEVEGTDIEVCKRSFKSDRRKLFHFDQSDSFYNLSDEHILENDVFSYPVFKHSHESNGLIILLHGLNERSWLKYYPWALKMAQNTGKDILLFPISFHMNRSPIDWQNARLMQNKLSIRKQVHQGVKMLSFANLALSERLTIHPERFLYSGYQSARDIISLVHNIKSGHDEFYDKNTSIDFFAYSIGAFLAQIIFMTNPKSIFSNSRLNLFCGGSVFDYMDGVSKYIMDSVAFHRLKNFYSKDMDVELLRNDHLRKIIQGSSLGTNFYAMTGLKRFNKLGKSALNKMKDHIQVISLAKDKVIPTDLIKKTLPGYNIQVLNPQYTYAHEHPFPIVKSADMQEVNTTFNKVFDASSVFLA